MRTNVFSAVLTASLRAPPFLTSTHTFSLSFSGIAVAFKQKFGRVQDLKAQGKKVGSCAVLDAKDGKGGRHFVYYLVCGLSYAH